MLIALLGAVMERVRFHTARSMVSDSSYLALQNSLAGFQRELWEDYHIFFVDVREAGGTKGLQEEIQENLDRSWQQGGLFLEQDWMGVSCLAEQVIPERIMTEDMGEELESQIMAYMKYRSVTATGEMLLEQMGMMRNLQKGEELFKKKLGVERSFSELEEKKIEIVGQVSVMEDVWGQAETAFSSIAGKVAGMSQEEGEQPDILAELDTIYRSAGYLSGQCTYLLRECGDYQVKYRETEQQKSGYETWLAEQKESMDARAWQTLREDLQELEAWQAKDAGYVESLPEPMEKNAALLHQMQILCGQGMADSEGEIPVETMAAALAGLMSQYQKVEPPEGFEMPGAGSGDTPFRKLNRIAAEGVLGLVLPPEVEVSKAVLRSPDWKKKELEKDDETEETKEEPIHDLLLLEYAAEHFGCYGESREDTVLQYEREYLLVGSERDKNNLAGVVEELLLVRTTADFLHLLTLPEKVAEARKLAVAMAGATGNSALIPVLKTGILLLWAVEDATTDVKSLMNGNKVPLYQDMESVSLDYEGYLNLLLLMTKKDRNLRMASLIEGNTQLRHEKAFRASDCAGGLRVVLAAEITPKLLREEVWHITEEYRLGYRN